MRSTFVYVFGWESKQIFFFFFLTCCLRSYWLNTTTPNVDKAALNCKNYTGIIKLTNLLLSFTPIYPRFFPPLPPPSVFFLLQSPKLHVWWVIWTPSQWKKRVMVQTWYRRLSLKACECEHIPPPPARTHKRKDSHQHFLPRSQVKRKSEGERTKDLKEEKRDETRCFFTKCHRKVPRLTLSVCDSSKNMSLFVFYFICTLFSSICGNRANEWTYRHFFSSTKTK